MLKDVKHGGVVDDVREIQFTTPFGYMFEAQAQTPENLLPVSERTEDALLQLGDAMGEPESGPAQHSDIPAVYTYLGQFIDHDITARTDRDTEFSRIAMADGRPRPMTPLDPAEVVKNLANGRRPQLDLDSLYGDGPGLLASPPAAGGATEAQELYESNMKLKMQSAGGVFDLPRKGRTALIADMRNDENLNVSQLHAVFLALHNKLMDSLLTRHSEIVAYIKARMLVRWVYQYVVIKDYLLKVCDNNVVLDVLHNGPRFFGPGTGSEKLFMPLEFSVAGFRFGHSMVRGSYTIRSGLELNINDILGVGLNRPASADLLEGSGDDFHVKPDHIVDWSNYATFGSSGTPQMARQIDTLIARGLFDLPFEESAPNTMLRHLAQRNLLRGYLLSIPTGQGVAAGMGIVPLTEDQLLDGEPQAIVDAIHYGRFENHTPLWYYVLREAKVQKDGNSLGAIGSRLVAETLIGFVKHDSNSYLNFHFHGRVGFNGVKVPRRYDPIASISDIIDYVGATH